MFRWPASHGISATSVGAGASAAALAIAHGLVCAEGGEHGVVAARAAVRECAHSVARDSVTCRFFLKRALVGIEPET